MKKALLLVILFAITAFSVHSTSLISKSKERFYIETSLILLQQEDSILKKEYSLLLERVNSDNEYTQSLYNALSLFEKSKKAGDIGIQYKSLYLIAEIYRRTRDHRRALNYFKKSLSYFELGKLESSGFSHFSEEDYADNLFKVGSEFQRMFLNDSAKIYFNKVSELNSLNPKILEFQAKSYSNLSGIYQNDSLYDQSRIFAQKAIEIQKKRNDKLGQANAINNLANIYLLEGDFEKSKSKYLEGLRLIQKDSSTRATRIKSEAIMMTTSLPKELKAASRLTMPVKTSVANISKALTSRGKTSRTKRKNAAAKTSK